MWIGEEIVKEQDVQTETGESSFYQQAKSSRRVGHKSRLCDCFNMYDYTFA